MTYRRPKHSELPPEQRWKASLTRSARKDILDLAEKWWQTNHHLVRKGINEVQFAPKVRVDPNGPAFITKPSPERDLDDGILEGREWDDLSIDEQAKVMFQYFSIVWLPAHPEVKLQRRH